MFQKGVIIIISTSNNKDNPHLFTLANDYSITIHLNYDEKESKYNFIIQIQYDYIRIHTFIFKTRLVEWQY